MFLLISSRLDTHARMWHFEHDVASCFTEHAAPRLNKLEMCSPPGNARKVALSRLGDKFINGHIINAGLNIDAQSAYAQPGPALESHMHEYH